jgi:hypothetical protein
MAIISILFVIDKHIVQINHIMYFLGPVTADFTYLLPQGHKQLGTGCLMYLHKHIQTLSDLMFLHKITIQDSAATDSALCFSIYTFCQNQTWPHIGTL